MDPWVLSDGTKVSLGGKVEGSSFTAQRLRGLMSALGTDPVYVNAGDAPFSVKLDPELPHLLDSFLRESATVVSAPAFDRPAAKPRPAPPKGAVY